MNRQDEVLLQLDAVSRIYPRDVSQIASAVMREMFLPLRALRDCPPTHFHALRNVNLVLARGEKVGILGAHRSGKSTLAGIAAGQLQPTSGVVTAHGARSLIAKPGAGFRPGLTVIENLSFRAMLAGVTGEAMHATVERTLAICEVSRDQAERAIGNLSRFVAKQLGLTLLLELPADILVIDEVTGAGTGDARWELRRRLQDRVDTTTSLVLSAHSAFIRDLVSRACVLHGGRLYGPFEVDKAIEAFECLPAEEDAEETSEHVFDPLEPPSVRVRRSERVRAEVEEDDTELSGNDEDDAAERVSPQDIARKKARSSPWYASKISVDGDDYRHWNLSLIRPGGSVIRVGVELTSLSDQNFVGGMFGLYASNTGREIGRFHYSQESVPVAAEIKLNLTFEVVVPDLGEDFYGLVFCPESNGKHYLQEHRIKLLIVGVGWKHAPRPEGALVIHSARVELVQDERAAACN